MTDQNWEKISSEVAFNLIERHAEDWADAGRMMEAWREATTADLRKNLAEALLDAERAREERNREHVRLNAEWMAKCDELRKDAERYRWVIKNMTFYNTAESEKPVLAEVSERIWYHATDNMTYPLSEVIDAALAKK